MLQLYGVFKVWKKWAQSHHWRWSKRCTPLGVPTLQKEKKSYVTALLSIFTQHSCTKAVNDFLIQNSLTLDNGSSLIWMHFSTLVFLLCTARKQTFQNKTGVSIPVNLTISKRKEGSSHCLYKLQSSLFQADFSTKNKSTSKIISRLARSFKDCSGLCSFVFLLNIWRCIHVKVHACSASTASAWTQISRVGSVGSTMACGPRDLS